MISYKERRRQCEQAGVIKHDHGVEVCGANRAVKCCGFSCPAKKYFNKGHEELGKHKLKSLADLGLKDQYEDEMVRGNDRESMAFDD